MKCAVCGADATSGYTNYLDQRFCWPCADGDTPVTTPQPPKYLSYPKWMYDLALEIIHRELTGVDNMSALADLLPHPLRDIAAGMLEYDRHRATAQAITPVVPLSESPLAKAADVICSLCHGPVGGDHPGHTLPDGTMQHDSIGSCNTVGVKEATA